jgi:hypothetical protein
MRPAAQLSVQGKLFPICAAVKHISGDSCPAKENLQAMKYEK